MSIQQSTQVLQGLIQPVSNFYMIKQRFAEIQPSSWLFVSYSCSIYPYTIFNCTALLHRRKSVLLNNAYCTCVHVILRSYASHTVVYNTTSQTIGRFLIVLKFLIFKQKGKKGNKIRQTIIQFYFF